MAQMQVYVILLFSPPSLNLASTKHVTWKRDLVERTKARCKPVSDLFRKTGRYERFPNVLLWIPKLEQRHDDLLIIGHSSGKLRNGRHYEIFLRASADQLLMEGQMPGPGNSSRQIPTLAEINSSQITGFTQVGCTTGTKP